MRQIWVARYELGRFDMEAYGNSPEEAKTALLAGVKRHIEQTGADADHFHWADEEAEPQCFNLGIPYRDGSELKYRRTS